MRNYDPDLEKYWVTQSGHFRLVTAVELGMGITYGNILFCHGVSYEIIKLKTISLIVYELFNNNTPVDYSSPYLNITPMPIDDSPRPNKRYQYTSDPLPDSIYVTSGKFVINLTTNF